MNKKKLVTIVSLAFIVGLSSCNKPSGHTHTYKWTDGKSPTCVDGGIVGHYICEGCDLVFNEDKEEVTLESLNVGALGHTYGSLIPQVDATCLKDGVKAYYQCVECKKYFDANKNETTLNDLTIHATGHNYGTLIAATTATCLTKGVAAHYECSDCHKIFDENKNETTLAALETPLAGHTLTHHDEVPSTYEQTGTCEYWSCDVCGKSFSDAEGKNEPITTVIPKLTHYTSTRVVNSTSVVIDERNDGNTYVSGASAANTLVFLHLAKEEAAETFVSEATFVTDGPWIDVGLGFAYRTNTKDVTFFATIDDMYGNGNASQGLFSDAYSDGSSSFNVPGATDAGRRLQINEAILEANSVDGATLTKDGSDRTLELKVSMVRSRYGIKFYLGKNMVYNFTHEELGAAYSYYSFDKSVEPVIAIRKHRADYGTSAVIKSPSSRAATLAEQYEAVKVAEVDYQCSTVAAHYYDEVSGKYFNEAGTEEVTYESLITTKEGSHKLTNHEASAPNCGYDGNEAYSVCEYCHTVFDANGNRSSLENMILPKTNNHTLGYVDRVESTTEQTGNIEYWHCSVCEKNFADEAASREVDNVIIPKVGPLLVDDMVEQTPGTYLVAFADNKYNVTYSSNGTYYHAFIPMTESSFSSFKSSLTFHSTMDRMDFGLGFKWVDESGNERVFMAAIDDMINSAQHALFSEGYTFANNEFRFNGANNNNFGVNTRVSYDASTISSMDGVLNYDNSLNADAHDVTYRISLTKTADGVTLYLGSTVVYTITYPGFVQTAGGTVNADTKVVPVVALRGHSPKRDVTTFEMYDQFVTAL